MKTWTAHIGLVVGGLSLFIAGCEQPTGESSVGDEATPLVQQTEAASDAPAHEGCDKHAKGGGGMLVHKALTALELTPEQRATLEALNEGDAEQDPKQAHRALTASLAAGVRDGGLDETRVAENIATLEKLGAAHHTTRMENLRVLHRTLSADQRSELVELVRAKSAEWRGHEAGEGDREDAPSADGKAGEFAHRDKHGMKGKHGMRGKLGPAGDMMAMVHGLDLSEDQRAELRESMGAPPERPSHEDMKNKFAAMRQKMDAMLDAFVSNDFDPQSVALDDGMAKRMREMTLREVDMVRKLIPILEAEQKEKLAVQLEAGRKGKRSHGARGPKLRQREGRPDMGGKREPAAQVE